MGRTQADVAQQLNIQRTTLQNYEHCRTPLKFETALRFCRQFIISEEWLATGKYAACWAAAPRHNVKSGPGKEHIEIKIFRRQCVDLLSEPAALHIRPGSLFADAYDDVLAAHYRRLVNEFFFHPRVVMTDSDISQLAINFLAAINERFILLLEDAANRRKLIFTAGWRRYTRHVFFASDVIFKRMMEVPFSAKAMEAEDMNWLRYISTEQAATIPFIGEEKETKFEARSAADTLVKN